MFKLRLALAAVAVLSLSACVSVKEPVGTSVGYVNDPALEGLWLSEPEDNKPASYVHVLLNDDATITVVGVAPRHGDDKASWGELRVTTAALGPNRYMNVREITEDGQPHDGGEGSIPLLYTITDGTLALFSFDEDKVADAIRAKRIEGTVEKSNFGTTVSITADGAHLDAALTAADARALFAPVMTLHRVK